MILELQKTIIYGPVFSRRLGSSLGLNILPAGEKVCPFNCVYCQYGWTNYKEDESLQRIFMPSVKDVEKSLKRVLRNQASPPRYLTFSGNGEASVHPDFGKMVDSVTRIRDRFIPDTKTAVLSNSCLAGKPEVRQALLKLDVRIMKLDCGLEEVFQRFNQPVSGINLDGITHALKTFPGICIQTLIAGGPIGNSQPENISAWLERLEKIKPAAVQIYTLDRGCPDDRVEPVSKNHLLSIRDKVRERGIKAEIY
ncbi:MAG: radical SAM protein [Candidatus Aminicenantes bacterium]|nr:radical SAM protein [Candidatus Aminicenantes bacterium]